MPSRRNDFLIDAVVLAFRARKIAYVLVVVALAPLGAIVLATAYLVSRFTKEDS